MILIIGLGNPGKKYQFTRHNIGFRVVNESHEKNRDVYNFSDFRLQKELSSFISKGKFNDKKIILAKPQTFMNNSGQSVKLLLEKLNNSAMTELISLSKKLFVVHDDIDLPLGKIKIVKNRGSAGHKGVESIIREIGTKNFIRFRIGIMPNAKFKMPRRKAFGFQRGRQNAKLQFKIQNLEDFVLKNFTKNEEKIVKGIIKKTVEAIEFSLKQGIEKAMSKFNK